MRMNTLRRRKMRLPACFRRADGAKLIARCVALSGLVLWYMNAAAQERLDLEGSRVTGNREAPKAFNILPWKGETAAELEGLKVDMLLEQELEPIDRESFRRQLELYQIEHTARAVATP